MIESLKRLNIYFKEMYPIIPRLVLGFIVAMEIYFIVLLNQGIVDFTFGIVVNNDYVFGDYVTKERALEVLGEIDERIMLLNTLSIAKDRDTLLALKNALPEEKLQGLAYPYEMPKEQVI